MRNIFGLLSAVNLLVAARLILGFGKEKSLEGSMQKIYKQNPNTFPEAWGAL